MHFIVISNFKHIYGYSLKDTLKEHSTIVVSKKKYVKHTFEYANIDSIIHYKPIENGIVLLGSVEVTNKITNIVKYFMKKNNLKRLIAFHVTINSSFTSYNEYETIYTTTTKCESKCENINVKIIQNMHDNMEPLNKDVLSCTLKNNLKYKQFVSHKNILLILINDYIIKDIEQYINHKRKIYKVILLTKCVLSSKIKRMYKSICEKPNVIFFEHVFSYIELRSLLLHTQKCVGTQSDAVFAKEANIPFVLVENISLDLHENPNQMIIKNKNPITKNIKPKIIERQKYMYIFNHL